MPHPLVWGVAREFEEKIVRGGVNISFGFNGESPLKQAHADENYRWGLVSFLARLIGIQVNSARPTTCDRWMRPQ